jgi:hypothetical protein
MRCCSIIFYVNLLAFSQLKRSYIHETISNGACAYVCAVNLDLRGRHADYWRSGPTVTANNNVEHIQHVVSYGDTHDHQSEIDREH